jgi:hypothetical protein
MNPAEIAKKGVMCLLLSVLDHYFGITHNRINRRLKLLANVCEKHMMETIVFVAQRHRLHDIPSITPRKDFIVGLG